MALVTWKTAVSGNWSTAANWSGGAVPSAGDDVEVALIGNYKVTVTAAEVANSLHFNAPGAQFVETAAGGLVLEDLTHPLIIK